MRRVMLIAACVLCSAAQAIGIGQVTQQQQQQALQRSGMRAVAPGASFYPARPLPPPSAIASPQAVADARDAIDAEIANASPEVVYTYDGVGNRQSATYKNGVVVLYTYDRRDRLTDLQASRGGALLHRYHYTFDASGLRTRIDATDADGATTVTTFNYDGVKRLTDETQTRNGVVDFAGHYAYDRTGNRTLATVNGVTTTYQYDVTDRLTRETTASGPLAGTTTYTHDAAGNVLTKTGPMGLVNYVYDDAGRLVEVTAGGDSVEYRYDYSGLMIGKTWTPAMGQVTHWQYVWDTSRDVPQTIEELSAEGTGALHVSATYVFGDGLVSETRDGVTRYVIQDGAGDTRALTDTGGAVTDTFTYDAWGNVVGRTGNTPVSHLYRSERLDPNLGFYYLRARWMDPTVGRFTQMDDYQGKPNEPASLHKYLYANADPVNLVDPMGHSAGGLSAQTAAIGIAAILAVAAKIGLDYMTRPAANNHRQFAVWDAVAVTQFNSKARANEDTDMLIGALATAASKEEGHHTIPVYLCGGMGQDTVKLKLADHLAIHAQIAAVRVALEGAEQYASKAIGRHRTSDILRIAQTELGRKAITNALYQVYDYCRWLDKPENQPRRLGEVFDKERPLFESGQETSLPWCTRNGGAK